MSNSIIGLLALRTDRIRKRLDMTTAIFASSSPDRRRRFIHVLSWSGMLFWFLTLGMGLSRAHDLTENQTVSLYERLAPATVVLSSAYVPEHPLVDSSSAGVGSGFILDKNGTVLTNAHVVAGATEIMATLHDGRRIPVEIIGTDPMTDVAALRLVGVDGPLASVEVGNSDDLKIGQQTLVLGNPLGLGFTLTTGIISGLIPLPGSVWAENLRMIQTTAPINPGNSGGPVINSKGRVIGIAVALVKGAQNIGFAIPINRAMDSLSELRSRGRVVRPWIGISGKFVSDKVRRLFALPLTNGFLIEDVVPESPAAEADLRSGHLDVTIDGARWLLGGDILVELQGQSVRSPEALRQAYQSLRVGSNVEVAIIRDGRLARLSLEIRERPNRPPDRPLSSKRALSLERFPPPSVHNPDLIGF